MRNTFVSWNHVLIYNKKLEKYIDVSQGRIKFLDKDIYIRDYLRYKDVEIYHVSAEMIKDMGGSFGVGFLKIAYYFSHTFVSTQYKKKDHPCIKDSWDTIKGVSQLKYSMKEVK